MAIENHFEKGWWDKLSPFLMSKEFAYISAHLKNLVDRGYSVTPKFNDVFRAFKECPYEKLKVVIMGQDPYYQSNVADGLTFSARYQPLSCPVSLRLVINAIEKEVYDGFAIGFNEEYTNPDLTRWANQGMLMINSSLTTIVSKTNQHGNLWAPFISNLFQVLRENNTGIIYILLGGEAKKWRPAIDEKNNYVLTATHPASVAHKGLDEWDSEGVFLKTNQILEQNNGPEAKILW